MNPLVSVVITTKNEEKNIENCLKSILRQSYSCDKIEVIVVDNNSTDRTKEIVEEFKKRFTPLNVQLFNRGPERSAQRNFGVEKSNGRYFLYLDADMILSKDVIKECVEKITCCSENPPNPLYKRGNNKDCHSELVSESVPTALYIPEIIMGKTFWCKVR